MSTYKFAIDETGSFDLNEYSKSFVCGILISQDMSCLKQKYQQAYTEFGLGSPPNDVKTLIGNETFHFSKMNDKKKNICKKLLLPLADKIYISKGKPTLFANNQNWWLVAVTVVIQEFLKQQKFEKEDTVEILIDNRSDITFGLVDNKGKNTIEFKEYHNILKKQIEACIKPIVENRSIQVEIIFSSDTSSYFVNLADIVCGFVRTENDLVKEKITVCSCSRFMSGDDPISFVNANPLLACSLVFQEIVNNKWNNVCLINNQIINRIANDHSNYSFLWEMFYDLLKSKIAARANHSNLVKIKPIITVFINEIKMQSRQIKMQASKRIELMTLFVEYFSHIGETEIPFEKEFVLNEIKKTGINSETRILRKWEQYLSYSLREAQIFFNAYNFEESITTFEKIWVHQEKIIDCLPTLITEDKKDEHTTAVIGTLAQSYAYNGEYEKAIEYFEMSKSYSIKTSTVTASYLFTVYHTIKNITKARECFFEQSGETPEEYFSKGNYENSWELLNYCKLRALELDCNQSTSLLPIDLTSLINCNSEYPFPLIQKWEGIAKWLEDPNKNKQIVERYFTNAIQNLLSEDNGFAVKTLALSIIQCFALVNNQNKFHAQYNTIIRELKSSSHNFESYVDVKENRLNEIKNKANIWERATLLPFIYS